MTKENNKEALKGAKNPINNTSKEVYKKTEDAIKAMFEKGEY